MKKKNEKGFWKDQKVCLVNSVKNIVSKRFFRSYLFDLAAAILIIVLFFLSSFAISGIAHNHIEQINKLVVYKESQIPDNLGAAFDSIPSVNNALVLGLLTFIVSYLLFTLIISLFYGGGWNSAKKERITWKFFKKYFLFNLLWFIFWDIIFLIIIFVVIPQIAGWFLLVWLLLFVIADFIMRSVFKQENTFRKNFSNTWNAFKKFHRFIPLIITALIICLIFILIVGIFAGINYYLSSTILILLFLLLVGWLRNYFIQLVKV